MSDSNRQSGGIGIGGTLFVVFVTLKLSHVIDWSWWWVTAPLWGSVGLLLIFAIFSFGIYLAFGRGR